MTQKQKIPTKYLLLFGIFVLVLVLDQWTKHWVHSQFRWGESLPVITDFFSLTYVRNKGAAFGFMNSAPSHLRTPFFFVIPITALFVIFFLIYRLEKSQLWTATALSLIFSGAVGNLIDRFRFGFVIDFLDFYYKQWHYPAFNVADSAIVVGVGMMLIQSFRESPNGRASHPPR